MKLVSRREFMVLRACTERTMPPMSSFVKVLCCVSVTVAACGGVGSEAIGPVDTAETRPVRRGAGTIAAALRRPPAHEGTWYLTVDGARFTLTVEGTQATLQADGETTPRTVEGLTWNADTGRLTFHCLATDGYRWFDGFVAGPVLRGRFARSSDRPPRMEAYTGQFIGWNATSLDRALYPRVFDVRLSDGRRARLRMDRAEASDTLAAIATYKVYGSTARASADEEPERPARIVTWDGRALVFQVDYPAGTLTFTGEVSGRSARGIATLPASDIPLSWTATRAEVLSHGLTPRSPTERRLWAEQTRRALARLMMDGAPAPTYARTVVLSTGLSPIRPLAPEPPGMLPQSYTLGQLRLEFTLRDPRGGADAMRAVNVWIARPSTPPPARGYPVVVALNGHGGSALSVMNPNHPLFAYGDAYARRGFVVLAVDVSHRPLNDRASLYTDTLYGDEAIAGNGPHPAVRHGSLPPSWEEDGERAWDVSRVLDHALALPDVDRSRVAVTGLSMGGEVATLAGAFDTRFTSVITAGFSPDLTVMDLNNNHPCWRWVGGDMTEYVDTSDLHALIAPRTLVVETGLLDRTFSRFVPPFASDKQVMRRARVAWHDADARVVHFLHGGAHVYRLGDPFFDATPTAGITVPLQTAPDATNAMAWQFDPSTTLRPTNVFDLAIGLNR
jgi:hypothetical protein